MFASIRNAASPHQCFALERLPRRFAPRNDTITLRPCVVRSDQHKIYSTQKSAATKPVAALSHDSSFLHKPLAALGAADADFSLALGDADALMAPGAGEIAMLPIAQAAEHTGKGGIFPLALFEVAREHPVDHQDKRNIRQQAQNRDAEECAEQIQHQPDNQQNPAKLVNTGAAGHEILNCVTHSAKHIAITVFIIQIGAFFTTVRRQSS
jgi:hypothetical protein